MRAQDLANNMVGEDNMVVEEHKSHKKKRVFIEDK
jgi:hypothetical protein